MREAVVGAREGKAPVVGVSDNFYFKRYGPPPPAEDRRPAQTEDSEPDEARRLAPGRPQGRPFPRRALPAPAPPSVCAAAARGEGTMDGVPEGRLTGEVRGRCRARGLFSRRGLTSAPSGTGERRGTARRARAAARALGGRDGCGGVEPGGPRAGCSSRRGRRAQRVRARVRRAGGRAGSRALERRARGRGKSGGAARAREV